MVRHPKACALFAAALSSALPATAHESHIAKPKAAASTESHPWGREGDPARARRVITVAMSDAMRFEPASITVRQGDTVRFEVANKGDLLHEMVIGTQAALEEHAALMKKFPGMEHAEPYMAHVKPGGRESIAWTFDRPGTFMYGCLIPGHWEAGMKGRIVVEPTPERKRK
jgi:uncharacterized cupredoxin-like copper-binding protein